MQGSRRAFLGGLAALVAAPAIVRVESLMRLPKPEIVRAPAISMQLLEEYEPWNVKTLVVLCDKMYVRPEWAVPEEFSLDEYSERIIGHMINRVQQRIADAVMHGSSTGELAALLGSTSPLE